MNKEAIIEFVTDPLRLTLIIAGGVVLLAILIIGRRSSRQKDIVYGSGSSRKDYSFESMPDDRLVDEEVIVLPRRKTESEVAAEALTVATDAPTEGTHFSAHFSASAEPVVESNLKANMEANLEALVETFDASPASEASPVVEAKVEPDSKKQPPPQTQQFVVLHVISAEGQPFTGKAIFDATQNLGMAIGKHNVFHYPADAAYGGDSAFCLTNMTAEGNFDLEKIEGLQTNGVSLILTLPTNYSDGLTVFSNMLAVSQALSKRLGGNVIDQNRMPLTSETVKSMRFDIEKFESQLQKNNVLEK